MGNHLPTINMGPKVGAAAAVPPLGGGRWEKVEAEATVGHKH